MTLIIITLVSIAFSMDVFAISLSNGIVEKQNIFNSIKPAALFGCFHCIMPLIGWLLTKSIISIITGYDCWIAFGILLFIGIKMIIDSYSKPEKNVSSIESMGFKTFAIIAFFTSFDAIAAGLRFSLYHVSILLPALMLGIIAFIMSILGNSIGKKLGKRFGKKINIFGGFFLLAIAVELLLENYNIINI